MSTELNPAIDTLERRLAEVERKANDLRSLINVLCVEAGLPSRYPEGSGPSGGGTKITQIKEDTFYGKKQQTAVREYLEMRKAQGLGPAKPRDIYEALRAGGYQFEAKDEDNALVGLRALLRKRTNIFHRLPNGVYGLLNWYPNARVEKSSEDGGDEDDEKDAASEEKETATVKKTAAA